VRCGHTGGQTRLRTITMRLPYSEFAATYQVVSGSKRVGMCGLFLRIVCIPSRLRMMQIRLVLHVPFRRAGVCSAFSCRAILAKESPSPRRSLILSTSTCSSGNGTGIRRPCASLSVLFPSRAALPFQSGHRTYSLRMLCYRDQQTPKQALPQVRSSEILRS